VLTTHTARHTGAALLVLGSEGDQTLKEIALGHTSASVYGYDTLERYGPRLLEAWEVALGTQKARHLRLAVLGLRTVVRQVLLNREFADGCTRTYVVETS
jgi:hypothetical protein